MQEWSEHKPLTKEDYNKTPVYYCKHCGSLAIMVMPGFMEDYCDKCGSTEIGKASIEAWLDLQKTKFKPIKEEPRRGFNIFK
jgi:hypothetical protein